MILIGIGASLPGPDGTPPIETCRAAVVALAELPGLRLEALSRWWEAAPVPPMPGAPWFVNGVARLSGMMDGAAILAALHAIEAKHHRARPYANAPRTLDLDLLSVDGQLADTPALSLPHPRMAQRGFVLHPLAEVAPGWRHPISGEPVAPLIARLPAQELRPLTTA